MIDELLMGAKCLKKMELNVRSYQLSWDLGALLTSLWLNLMDGGCRVHDLPWKYWVLMSFH